jgi:multiple antibiotic resistance protein
MFESALIAFATFFATVGPPDVAVVFAALTPNNTSRRLSDSVNFILVWPGK